MAGSRYLALRRADRCASCESDLTAGTRAWWDANDRTVTCLACHEPTAAADLGAPIGGAGSSAQREHDRRLAKDEERVRSKHKHLGGAIWRLSKRRTSTEVWGVGAAGERFVGARLDPLVEEGIVIMHDVRLPGKRTNIDHVAISSSGMYIIDTKLYRDQKIAIRTFGLLGRQSKLVVGGRDKTSLATGLTKQILMIESLLVGVSAAKHTIVTPVLCFVRADWGLFQRPITFQGVRVLWSKELLKLIRRPGRLTHEQITELGNRLATTLEYD